MLDAMKSSVPGRELGALGRGDVPVPMAAPSVPVRRREADGRRGPAPPGRDVRERPKPVQIAQPDTREHGINHLGEIERHQHVVDVGVVEEELAS